MKFTSISAIAFPFLLVAVGFLFSFWPLCLAGILLAAWWGRWASAVIFGLLLDLAWGAPLGRLHVLYFPFTILAALTDIGLFLLWRYLRKGPVDRL